MQDRRRFLGLALGLAMAGPLGRASAEDRPLRIALAASPANEAVAFAAGLAEKQGLKVKIIEFNDWVTPNSALQDGEVDVNYFQHIPFLKYASQANGWKFAAVAPGYISWLGVYSEKLKSIGDLKDGSTVAFANDPVNTGRALLFMQSIGLLELKDGADFTVTIDDIVSNPRKLKFVEVEAQQVVRSLPDVDIGLTFASFMRLAGKDPASALLYEKPNPVYAIYWVTREADKSDPRLAAFIKIYDAAPEVKEILKRLYSGQVGFAW